MARSGKAQKQLVRKIKGERIIKQAVEKEELIKKPKKEVSES
jgi:hypothetical protein